MNISIQGFLIKIIYYLLTIFLEYKNCVRKSYSDSSNVNNKIRILFKDGKNKQIKTTILSTTKNSKITNTTNIPPCSLNYNALVAGKSIL
jgi:hypothetical protein